MQFCHIVYGSGIAYWQSHLSANAAPLFVCSLTDPNFSNDLFFF